MKSRKHKPNIVWGMRRGPLGGDGKQANGYICTTEQGGIGVRLYGITASRGHCTREGRPMIAADMTRADARLLARRILQCLEET